VPSLSVHMFSISTDGFAAGATQSRQDPLGVGGESLHTWAVASPAFHGRPIPPGEANADDRAILRGTAGIGATIMGRNMFGPIRGAWPTAPDDPDAWRGWWGDDPPYHHPVFVLTHHPQPSITMDGGTTFHFVNEAIDTVLTRAFEAAAGQDVRLGGGASVVRQYLEAGLVDELNLVVVPVLLGDGERLFEGLTPPGYEVAGFETSDAALHVRLIRKIP
jgi:dihydrofolate reductase